MERTIGLVRALRMERLDGAVWNKWLVRVERKERLLGAVWVLRLERTVGMVCT